MFMPSIVPVFADSVDRCPDFRLPVTVLAPMDGLTDPLMRQVLSQIGKYDWAVSEFIRVTQTLLPDHVFLKAVPELANQGKTQFGMPVHVQLLGSDPILMAENAHKLAEMKAPAIDLNFGCPAKTVNQHRGGAILLNEPDTLYQIIHQVRQSVPNNTPVSAKIRLGYEDDRHLYEIAHAVQSAGANWLTIHARTKTQAYTPPAYWHAIAPLSQSLDLPIIANGEIWTLADAQNCRNQAKTLHLMLGRGAVSCPDLVNQIKAYDMAIPQTDPQSSPYRQRMDWQDLRPLQTAFLQGQAKNDGVLVGRYKQWLGMLTRTYPEAQDLWQKVKKEKDKTTILQLLKVS